ncbi:hypothetical protein [Lacrimispora indolis]|uniref:hypothetical protein n=1 Tax=Lacrimispora indolis TaxID=69825 RepID=UPI00045E846B|nr:hypothetical protein [Lacrimispora indolis]
MRIVSQNGKYDAPYEQCIISVRGGMITAEIPSTNSSTCSFLMGEYSSPEKVQKAMEMLHREYIGIMPSLIISDCGFSQTDLEDLKQSMVGGQIMVPSQGDGRVEYHMLPQIFRFPADEEIEVEE